MVSLRRNTTLSLDARTIPGCPIFKFLFDIIQENINIFMLLLQAISKIQSTFKDTARANEKTQHRWRVCEHFA
jgi:hypothetical protein